MSSDSAAIGFHGDVVWCFHGDLMGFRGLSMRSRGVFMVLSWMCLHFDGLFRYLLGASMLLSWRLQGDVRACMVLPWEIRGL